MKRRILCLMASLLLVGVVNAQSWWETAPNSHNWSSNTPIVAAISIDGDAQTDFTNLTLGAFASDGLRGTTYNTNSVYNNQVWIQVYYDFNTTEAISFKLYDAATQTEYTTCTVTPPTTTQDEGWGTPGNPVVLDFTNAPQIETQTIALTAGTNWFSTYVDVSLDDLQTALVTALPNTVIRIKSETQNIVYSRGMWNGTLDWDASKMYMIVVSAPCEISLEGNMIDATSPIIISGSGNTTWIGYPFRESMAVTNAFAEIVLNGDRVKSENGNSVYSRGQWNGSVTTIEPGKGFIYISSSTAPDRELVYPAPTQN